MYMEAMLGISLYNYLYPKLSKWYAFLIISLCFLFNKIREEGRIGSASKEEGLGIGEVREVAGEVSQTMYTHVSKC
jgi:hypothetical protein